METRYVSVQFDLKEEKIRIYKDDNLLREINCASLLSWNEDEICIGIYVDYKMGAIKFQQEDTLIGEPVYDSEFKTGYLFVECLFYSKG